MNGSLVEFPADRAVANIFGIRYNVVFLPTVLLDAINMAAMVMKGRGVSNAETIEESLTVVRQLVRRVGALWFDKAGFKS